MNVELYCNFSNSASVFSPTAGLGEHIIGEVYDSSKITGASVSVLSSLDVFGFKVGIAGLVSVPETLADQCRDVRLTGSLFSLEVLVACATHHKYGFAMINQTHFSILTTVFRMVSLQHLASSTFGQLLELL
jgi:hypothetical protein